MASSGAAAPSTFHEGRLKPYPHEELGTPTDVRIHFVCDFVARGGARFCFSFLSSMSMRATILPLTFYRAAGWAWFGCFT